VDAVFDPVTGVLIPGGIPAAAVPQTATVLTHNPTLFYAGLAGPIVAGAKHIVGGREWAALLTAKK
jgi:hypothetical protein